MATTYSSNQVASTVQARAEHGVNCVKSTHEFSAALVINDVFQMVKVPLGATILETILAVDDVDAATSELCTFAVGDGTTATRFIAAAAIGRAAANVARLDQVDGLGYKYTAADTIDVKVIAAPGSSATAGTITLVVIYHCYGFN